MVHSGALSWGCPHPVLLAISWIGPTFKDRFCLLDEDKTHTWTRVGAFPITVRSARWLQEPGTCLHPITVFTAQGVGAKLLHLELDMG